MKTQWGKWRFEPSNLTLVLCERPWYEIDLETIHDSASMLDWIMQIRTKSWATSQIVGDLVAAFNDLFDPQANLCSGGSDTTIDPTWALANTDAAVADGSVPLQSAMCKA